jgi:hypothetical protein
VGSFWAVRVRATERPPPFEAVFSVCFSICYDFCSFAALDWKLLGFCHIKLEIWVF